MKKIKFVKEDVLNGYIVTDDKIIASVGTKRPDLDFDTLRNIIYAYNAYLDTGLAPREIIALKSNYEKMVKEIKSMKKIKVWWETDYAGCDDFEEFEVDDNTTDKEIEEMAQSIAFEHFSWGWEKSNE